MTDARRDEAARLQVLIALHDTHLPKCTGPTSAGAARSLRLRDTVLYAMPTVSRIFSNFANGTARIVVVRLTDATGLLCAVPALRALRGAAPNAHITLLGLPSAAELAGRFSAYVNDFISTPRGPRIGGDYDLAVELQAPDDELHTLTEQLGARFTAGFRNGSPNGTNDATQLRVEWPEQGPELLRLLLLVRALGIRDQGDALEFPFTPHDRSELQNCRDALALVGGPFVCIQPGGRLPERRWQASRYARVADALAVHGLRIALTGPASDRPVAEAVAARMRSRAIDLTGCLTMGAYAVLLDYAYLLISNDTGVTRLAEAIGTPSVTIASGSDVPLWRPSDRARYRVLWLPGRERPSAERLFSTWPDNASGITVEAVLDACDALLAEPALKQRAAVRAHLARLRHESRLARPLAPAAAPARTEVSRVLRAS
ncbi:MAG TPA: glycosyltransferase family 9 protein [Gemmatimonadaceae bacterium]|nr:glycosyltransferase family 9 protein [Gemmatimonadaceae bacterium]